MLEADCVQLLWVKVSKLSKGIVLLLKNLFEPCFPAC